MKDLIFMYMIPNTWLNADKDENGWGNGYVAVPKGHPWFGVDYSDIPFYSRDCEELTYSRMVGDNWVVGFDTNHIWNNLKEHDMEYTLNCTRVLMAGAIDAC
jgi:hypothetical protein